MSSFSFHSDCEFSFGVSLILGDYDGWVVEQGDRRMANLWFTQIQSSLLANTSIASENEINPKLNTLFNDLINPLGKWPSQCVPSTPPPTALCVCNRGHSLVSVNVPASTQLGTQPASSSQALSPLAGH
jgi:hypothetical protein